PHQNRRRRKRETLVGLRPPDVPRLRRQVAYVYAAVWPDFAPPLTDFDVDFEPIKIEVENWTREKLEENDKFVKQVHANVRKLADDARKLALQVIDQSTTNSRDHKSVITEISSQYDKATAYAYAQVLVATGPGSAISQRLDDYGVAIDGKASANSVFLLT